MQINTNIIRLPATTGIGPDQTKVAPQSHQQTEFTATNSLNEALRQTPDVRQAEIQRATRLVEQGNYPPPELISRLSRLLADELSGPKS